jgi:hypothetical protein
VRKLSAAILLLLLSASTSFAQSAEPTKRATDKKFWMLAAGLTTAMVLDTKSTFDVSRWCASCEEKNPFVRPFVERGPALTFTAGVAFDAGVIALSAKMRRSDRTFLRRTWWVVPVALMSGHTIAWRHNLNLAPDQQSKR